MFDYKLQYVKGYDRYPNIEFTCISNERYETYLGTFIIQLELGEDYRLYYYKHKTNGFKLRERYQNIVDNIDVYFRGLAKKEELYPKTLIYNLTLYQLSILLEKNKSDDDLKFSIPICIDQDKKYYCKQRIELYTLEEYVKNNIFNP